MIHSLCTLTFFVTLILFVVYWWKKRKARLAAGEDYKNDEQYKKISGHKSLIGLICILSFILAPVTAPQMTPEERAAYEAEQAQKKAQKEAEQKRLAEEKAAKEAEEQKLLAEKKAQEEAEAKRLAEEKAAKERKYVGTYGGSGMKAYIVPGTLKVSRDRDSCKVQIVAENDAGDVSYLDYDIWREGGSLHFSNSEGFSGLVTPNMTVENKIWEVARNEGNASESEKIREKADEREIAQKDEEPGIWERAKKFVGGVIDNEVHVCDTKLGSYYFLPSTKKRKDDGIIFKDEGYEVEVICRHPNGKVFSSVIYRFCERNDGTVEYKINDGSWHRLKNTYSEFEEIFEEQVGARVYEASKHFPNL